MAIQTHILVWMPCCGDFPLFFPLFYCCQTPPWLCARKCYGDIKMSPQLRCSHTLTQLWGHPCPHNSATARAHKHTQSFGHIDHTLRGPLLFFLLLPNLRQPYRLCTRMTSEDSWEQRTDSRGPIVPIEKCPRMVWPYKRTQTVCSADCKHVMQRVYVYNGALLKVFIQIIRYMYM